MSLGDSGIVSDGLKISSVDLGIRSIHLVTGEDVIGTVFASETGLTVDKPMIAHISTSPNGGFRIGLIPLRPYIETPQVVFEPAHVVWLLPVTEQMQQIYRQSTSNIVVAGPGDVPNLDITK